MKKILLTLGFLLVPVSLFSQIKTTVTGNVQTSNGNPATSGYVQFNLRPSNSNTAFRVAGLAVIVPSQSRCNIQSNGTILATNNVSPCQVWGNTTISPANTCYDIILAPNNVVASTIQSQLVSGTSYDLSQPVFCPQVSIVPQYQTITVPPLNSNLIPGANDVFTIGSSGAIYSQGWFDQLHANSLSGTAIQLSTVKICDQFAGATADVQMNACLNSLCPLGGVGDARGIHGGTIAGNPFAGVSCSVRLYLGTGPFNQTGTITPCSGCFLFGNGPDNTVLTKQANIDMIAYGDQTKASLAYTGVADLTLNGNKASFTQNCISTTNINYAVFSNLEIFNCNLKGISLGAANHIFIDKIKTYTNSQDGISISSLTGTGFTISSITTGNPTTIVANGSLQAIAYTNGSQVAISGATGCSLINGSPYTISNVNLGANSFTIPVNTTGCGAYSANSATLNHEFYNSFFISITNSTDDNDGVYSVSLSTQSASTSDPRPHDISLNGFKSTGSNLYGVEAKGGDRISITNGSIEIPGTHCINLGVNPFLITGATVTNVTCVDPGRTQSGAGIFCNCTNSTFSGNTFTDNQGVPTMKYGIWLNQDSSNVVTGNNANGYINVGYCTGSPASTNVISGNAGTVQVGSC